MAIKERQRFQRLAALELSKDAREHRAEPLGGDRVKDFAHIRVARDALNAVDGLQIALGPLLVKGEERGLMWLYSSGHMETRTSYIVRGVFDESAHDENIFRSIQGTRGETGRRGGSIHCPDR